MPKKVWSEILHKKVSEPIVGGRILIPRFRVYSGSKASDEPNLTISVARFTDQNINPNVRPRSYFSSSTSTFGKVGSEEGTFFWLPIEADFDKGTNAADSYSFDLETESVPESLSFKAYGIDEKGEKVAFDLGFKRFLDAASTCTDHLGGQQINP